MQWYGRNCRFHRCIQWEQTAMQELGRRKREIPLQKHRSLSKQAKPYSYCTWHKLMLTSEYLSSWSVFQHGWCKRWVVFKNREIAPNPQVCQMLTQLHRCTDALILCSTPGMFHRLAGETITSARSRCSALRVPRWPQASQTQIAHVVGVGPPSRHQRTLNSQCRLSLCCDTQSATSLICRISPTASLGVFTLLTCLHPKFSFLNEKLHIFREQWWLSQL